MPALCLVANLHLRGTQVTFPGGEEFSPSLWKMSLYLCISLILIVMLEFSLLLL